MSECIAIPNLRQNPALWLAAIHTAVDAELRRFFDAKAAKAAALHAALPTLVNAVRDLTMRGGKRIRPLLVVTGFRCVVPAEADLTDIIGAAVAAELMQSFLLIHDDWMDQDRIRRGGPSVHVALGDLYKDDHVGDSAAILAGNLAAAYAWEALTSAPFPAQRLLAAAAALCGIEEQVAFGQLLDIVGCRSVATVHLLKTASYSVCGPLRIGAILGGAMERQLRALDTFAQPLGLAFQLRDDLLGTFGNPDESGRPVGSDLRSGKMTALIIDALQHLDSANRQRLEKILKGPHVSEAEMTWIKQLLEDVGSRHRLDHQVRDYVAQAVAALADSPLDASGIAALEVLAQSMTARAQASHT